MTPKYEFGSGLEYQLKIYKDKLDFAMYQVKSQLAAANKRKLEEKRELQMWSGILMTDLVFLLLLILLCMSASVAVMVAVPLLFLVVGCTFILVPVCCNKIIKGIFLIAVDKENRLGKWLMEKAEIPTQRSEIIRCQMLINRYYLLEEDIQKWQEECRDGMLSVDEETIMKRLESMNYQPEIQVVSQNTRKLMELVKWVSSIVWILVMAMVIAGIVCFASELVKGYVGTIRQM